MNLDKLKLFPNQLTDSDQTECCALTVSDIAGNIFNTPFSNDFTYAATLNLENIAPTDAGADPRAAMYSVPLYGLLPASFETFTSKTEGELYAANFANYTPAQKQLAKEYQMCAKPVPMDYQDVIKVLQSGYAVSLAMKWYWGSNPPTILTLPTVGQQFTNHNVAVYDWEDPRGLTVKPWLGASAGENGYCFLPRDSFNASAEFTMQFDSKASVALQTISLKIVFYPTFNALFA